MELPLNERNEIMLRGLTTAVYPTADLDGAVRWYADLLGIEPYFTRPGYTEFRLGDYSHELGLIDKAVMGQIGPDSTTATDPAGVILYWHVDDVQAVIDRTIAAGATLHQPPMDFGEGFIGASVIDPFGNILGLMHNPHYLEVLESRS